jgi:hypothetical protein
MKSPGNQETQEVCKCQERPQESKKTAKSQESRTSRVWNTGRIQESRSRRITPDNTAYSLQQEEERKRKERETPVSKAW